MTDKDKLLAALVKRAKQDISSANHYWLEGFRDALDVVGDEMIETKELNRWHEIFEDDPDSFPNDDRLVLVSFSNFTEPMLGRFIDGAFCIGDMDETFVSNNLFVDGWWELPKKPEVE